MSTAQNHIQITIHLFDEAPQRALIVPQLTVRELLEAITDEFRSIAYLSDAPDQYVLVRVRGDATLDPAQPLGQQLQAGDQVRLVEAAPPLPSGAQPVSKPAYLRDETSGVVYPLHWTPALIGRPDAGLPHNDQIAVDLADHDRGMRVSRRHARITEQNGQFVIESLSRNATLIKNVDGQTTVVENTPQPLRPGQTVVLEQSQINLKFMVREKASGA